VQLVLYLTGSVVAFFLLLHKIPGGWPSVAHIAAASGGKLSIFDFSFSLTRSYTFWSGLLGGTFLTMASHGTDQTMVQRLLAARNERDAKTALLSSGVLIFAQFALFLILGVMLFAFAQHAPLPIPGGDADRIFPEFIVREMPVGIAGFVLASIFAVAMSNASGSLNSLASSSMIDFGRKARAAVEPQQVKHSRYATLAWGLVLGALGLAPWGHVLEAGLTIASITYGGLLGVFLLGLWNRRANQTGALAGLVAGIAAMVAVRFATPLAYTWYVLTGTVVTCAVGSLASLLSRRGFQA